MGTTGTVARATGRHDTQALSNTLLRMLCLAMALGFVIIALHQPLIDLALSLIDSSEATETRHSTRKSACGVHRRACVFKC